MNKIEKLEIRGIKRGDLIAYLIDLGGEYFSDCRDGKKVKIGNQDWQCDLSEEETYTFMHSEIPKVYLTFQSENQPVLVEVIRKFRLKSFRAGG
ncbi:hypothetical protein ACM26V_01050 [Salipaludibacillus sp. HK11]|uniref:hypothetical protein n=1 Tax=Salipaludibacillus sp. HK11 TaxID=3394320 RepID=UPI0039FCD031